MAPNPANPANTASWGSRLLFLWVNQFMRLRGNVAEADLYELQPDDSTVAVHAKLSRAWKDELRADAASPPSVARAYARAFGGPYAAWSIVIFIKAAFMLAQTQFLARLLERLSQPSLAADAPDDVPAYMWALALTLCSVITGVLHQWFFYSVWRAGMRWKAAGSALIFEKSLALRQDGLAAVSVGQVVSLLSNDLEKFSRLAQFLIWLVLTPLESAVAGALLAQEVGWQATLACFALLLFFVGVQSLFSKRFSLLRAATARITDERVRVTGQVIAGARVLKLNAWEPPFARLVAGIRAREIVEIGRAAFLRGSNDGVFSFATVVLGCVVFLVAWGTGGTLTPRAVFTSVSLLTFLQVEVTKFLPTAMESIAEIRITFRRMQAFLLLPEMRALRGADAATASSPQQPADMHTPTSSAIIANEVWCAWTPEGHEAASDINRILSREERKASRRALIGLAAGVDATPTPAPADAVAVTPVAKPPRIALKGVSLRVERGALCAVIGRVGSGKSTLIQAILGELPPIRGSVSVAGSVAFVPQVPWVLSGTLRDNITFGLPFDADKYARAIEACCLEADIATFADGHDAIIGERGVSLSGGQRARLGLARACYMDADVYVLDDPLSAVDSRVGGVLMDACVCGLLANKTRLLVTHQLQHLDRADSVVVMEAGSVVAEGPMGRLRTMADEAAAAGEGAEGHAPGRLVREMLDALNAGNAEPPVDDIVDSQPAEASTKSDAPPDAVTPSAASTPGAGEAAAATGGGQVAVERMAEGSVGVSVLSEYAKAAGGGFVVFYLSVLFAVGTTLTVMSSVILARWSAQPQAQQREALYPALYAGLVVGAAIVCWWRAVAFFERCVAAAASLHDAAFFRMLRAPLSFFDSNPAGRILNRFSKDLALVDEALPWVFQDFTYASFAVFGVLALVIAVNPWVALAVVPLVITFFYLRKYYLLTARTVKRLDGVSRSPVFAVVAESLSGLAVIRSFGMKRLVFERFVAAQDGNSRAYWLFLVTSRWLGLRLDALCICLLAACSLAAAGSRRAPLDPGLVGLALTQVITLISGFQWCVRQSAELENLFVAVERVCEYAALPVEDVDVGLAELQAGRTGCCGGAASSGAQAAPVPDNAPAAPSASADAVAIDLGPQTPAPLPWPQHGRVEVSDLCMRYRPDLAPVLRGVSFSVEPGMKVGVVGRTGAGKSSLLLALLRLVEPERKPCRCAAPPPPLKGGAPAPAGSGGGGGDTGIRIDGLDIGHVDLSTLRRGIACIAQDPVLFSGTLRSNLDPFKAHSDEECLTALGRVQLLPLLASHGGRGLDKHVAEGGSNLSVGQRQLVALARAILVGRPLILMDEATANTDLVSDAAIQTAVRSAFASATVITVAHRLHTVIDCDLVVVMDAGVAAEAGHPHDLLSRPPGGNSGGGSAGEGLFAALVRGAGPAAEAGLRRAAEAAHRARSGAGAGAAVVN